MVYKHLLATDNVPIQHVPYRVISDTIRHIYNSALTLRMKFICKNDYTRNTTSVQNNWQRAASPRHTHYCGHPDRAYTLHILSPLAAVNEWIRPPRALCRQTMCNALIWWWVTTNRLTAHDPLDSAPSRWGSWHYLIQSSLGPHNSAPKQHLDRFSRFCAVHRERGNRQPHYS